MSETQNAGAFASILLNMKVQEVMHPDPKTGVKQPTGRFDVRWGPEDAQRWITVEPLTMGKQLDFLETMPPSASAQWQTMAMAAASVTEINNIPTGRVFEKTYYRNMLDKLGEDGFKAVLLVLNGYPGAGEMPAGAVADVEAAAGN